MISLGAEGYSLYFFKKVWDIVERDFMDVVWKFFSLRTLLKQKSHTEIMVLPKSSQAQKVEDYRLISCYNVFYKVIFKIIVSQLSTIFDFIIDPVHATFIRGRSIIISWYKKYFNSMAGRGYLCDV